MAWRSINCFAKSLLPSRLRYFAWTYYQHVAVFKIVINTVYQRILVAYDNHFDVIVFHKFLDCGEIERREVDVAAILRCAAVTGGYEQLSYQLTLIYFPCKCRFTAAGSEEKNVVSTHVSIYSWMLIGLLVVVTVIVAALPSLA